MKILILSDNHYRNIDLDLNKYDYIIHCGDYGNSLKMLEEYNTFIVRGNCDIDGPKEIFCEINGRKIFITHGDLYNVKIHYNSITYKAMERKVDFVFFGHTHRMDMFIHDNIVFINTGSYQDGSYVEIDDNKISFYNKNRLIKSFEYRW